MSESSLLQLACQRCHSTSPCRIVSGFDAEKEPDLLEQLAAGEVNVFVCARCGHREALKIPLTVTDGGSQFVYRPFELLPSLQALPDRYDEATEFFDEFYERPRERPRPMDFEGPSERVPAEEFGCGRCFACVFSHQELACQVECRRICLDQIHQLLDPIFLLNSGGGAEPGDGASAGVNHAVQTQTVCPRCRSSHSIQVWREIDVQQEPGLLQDLLEEKVNVSQCPHCGHTEVLDTPLSVRDGGVVFLLAPIASVRRKDSGILARIAFHYLAGFPPFDAFQCVFSLRELARQLHCRRLFLALKDLRNAKIKARREWEDRMVADFRNHCCAPEIENRTIGKYRSQKRKLLSFAAGLFKPGVGYTESEVNRILSDLGAVLGHSVHGAFESTHIRSALCEIGVLCRTADGRRYWREPAPDRREELGPPL